MTLDPIDPAVKETMYSSSKKKLSIRSPYETSLTRLTPNQSFDKTFNSSYHKSFNLLVSETIGTSYVNHLIIFKYRLGDVSLNQSLHLNQSATLHTQTAHHSLRSYNSLLPVLVIEAISSERKSNYDLIDYWIRFSY